MRKGPEQRDDPLSGALPSLPDQDVIAAGTRLREVSTWSTMP